MSPLQKAKAPASSYRYKRQYKAKQKAELIEQKQERIGFSQL